MTYRIFSLNEANAMLPELKEDLKQLQIMTALFEKQYTDLQKSKARLAGSSALMEDRGTMYFEAESQLEFMRIEVELFMQNFGRKGVLLKMINPGLIDFPAMVNEKAVLLCWREGEETITHYHGWEEGYMGRRIHPDAY
ncbi:DUF2203 domain-containing protein [Paenibacillus puerhi]|uniref:DUF2203 domain-containing protein n=1 Tax=Paenibacillus puerhi TaxID=2692622 RepID=UPI00135770EB|nr:DUF2203 domain-containing protein [Paenibacillus puerhi]